MSGSLVHLGTIDLDDDVRAAGEVEAQVDRLGGDLGMVLLVDLPLALVDGDVMIVVLGENEQRRVEADDAQGKNCDQYDGPQAGFPFHELFKSFEKNMSAALPGA
jgi:hypothetical protein